MYDHELQAFETRDLKIDARVVDYIDLNAYVSKGGRVEADLFQEQPDKLLDADLIYGLFSDLMSPASVALEIRSIKLETFASNPAGAPEGAIEPDWDFKSTADPEAQNEADKAKRVASEAVTEARKAKDFDRLPDLICDYAVAASEAAVLARAPLHVVAARIYPDRWGGDLNLQFFVDAAEYKAHMATLKKGKATETVQSGAKGVPQSRTRIETTGYTNPLHQKVTHTAGMALARTLADNPEIAFNAQLATQFQQCIGQRTYYGDRPDKLLQVGVRSAGNRSGADETFIAPILDRASAYRDAFNASGLHPFEWVRSMDPEARVDLFAIITALQIDAGEDKIDNLRLAARAEAAHIAAATEHDIRTYWTPSAEFWAEFSKKQLLSFIEAMGQDPKYHATLKRDELAPIVADMAIEHKFVPPALVFELEVDAASESLQAAQ